MVDGLRAPGYRPLIPIRLLLWRPQHPCCPVTEVLKAPPRMASNTQVGKPPPRLRACIQVAKARTRAHWCRKPVDRTSCWSSAETLLYRVNAPRDRHPRNVIAGALRNAEPAGWPVAPTSSGHRWGVMRCGEASRSGCQVSIWSTPRNSGTHAKQLTRFVDRCHHKPLSEGRRS